MEGSSNLGLSHLCSEEDAGKAHLISKKTQLKGSSRLEYLPSSKIKIETEELCAIQTHRQQSETRQEQFTVMFASVI